MTSQRQYEYAIIGAGPAGVQIAGFLKSAGRSYVVLERGEIGSFFERYPRHRRLISINKRFTGSNCEEYNRRTDWNSLLPPSDDSNSVVFRDYSREFFPHADAMVRYLRDFSNNEGIDVREHTEVNRVSRTNRGDFYLETSQGGLRSEAVIVATGLSRTSKVSVPGYQLAEPYSQCSTDAEDYEDQRVLIIGTGNSAFEVANNMLHTASSIHLAARTPVEMAWNSHFVGHVRAVNAGFLDTYELKAQNSIINAPVLGLEMTGGGSIAVDFGFTRGPRTLEYDRVIDCTGFSMDTSIFDASIRPHLCINDKLPELTCDYESKNVANLYFCGALTQSLDYRKSTSAFIHGFRYGARALSRTLLRDRHDVGWSCIELGSDPSDVAKHVLGRIATSSGLWQQFGVLHDMLLLTSRGFDYYEELPWGQIERISRRSNAVCVTISLQYGDRPSGVSAFDGSVVHASEGDVSPFFHPVLTTLVDGNLTSTVHLPSDIENNWDSHDGHFVPATEVISDAKHLRAGGKLCPK